MSQSPENAGAWTVRARRSASVDLPVPGSPVKMMICGPAPALFTYRRLASPCLARLGDDLASLPSLRRRSKQALGRYVRHHAGRTGSVPRYTTGRRSVREISDTNCDV